MRLLTVAEAAEYCRCSEHTIRRWITCGTLRATKPGRAILIQQEDLDTLLSRPAIGLERYVQLIVNGAPKLTEEQITRLREALGRRSA